MRLRHPLDARRFSPFLPFLALQMSGRLVTLRGSSGITTFRLQAHVCQNAKFREIFPQPEICTLCDDDAPPWQASLNTLHENTVAELPCWVGLQSES